MARLNGHQAKVTAIAVSADGKRAASAGWDRTVRIWDLEQRSSCTSSRRSTTSMRCASRRTGRGCFAGTSDGSLQAWRVSDGAPLSALRGARFRRDGARSGAGRADCGDRIDRRDGAAVGSRARRTARHPLRPRGAGAGGGAVARWRAGGIGRRRRHGAGLAPRRRRPAPGVRPPCRPGVVGRVQPRRRNPVVGRRRWPGPDLRSERSRRRTRRRRPGWPRRCRTTAVAARCCSASAPPVTRSHPTAAIGPARPSIACSAGSPAATPTIPIRRRCEESDLVWTEETVARLFEVGPEVLVPGSKMPLQRMPNAEDRARPDRLSEAGDRARRGQMRSRSPGWKGPEG